MKNLLILFLFLNPFVTFTQSEDTDSSNSCEDSIVTYDLVTCLESKDTLFHWLYNPDSVSIKVYNRWGNLVLKSEDKHCSIFTLLADNDKETIPAGTYYIVFSTIKNGVQKMDCGYIYIRQNCGCG